ncbi:MAG: hypothetical protein COB46_07890 [Rhodospirillaceae bacterium]|nr:MAG: hypothetical protein COB46_07890 [Rhodospirillaceae bacterium]
MNDPKFFAFWLWAIPISLTATLWVTPLPAWTLPIVFAFTALTYLACAQYWERKRHVYQTSWFRPDEKAKSHAPTWEDVKKIITNDPLQGDFEGKHRGVEFPLLAKDLALGLTFLAALVTIILILASGKGFETFVKTYSEKLTVFGALFGVAITLYIASYARKWLRPNQ